MIIGVDARVFQEREPTGVTRYAHFFIEELGRRYPKARFALFISGIRPFTAPEFSPELSGRITWYRLKIPHLILNIGFLIFRFPKLDLWFGKKINSQLDLLVIPNLHFVAISRKAKVLLVVHDLSFVHEPRWFSWKSRLWHWLVLRQHLWPRANLLVSVSQITACDLEKTVGINFVQVIITA